MEELNERLDKLAVREQETEAQKVTWTDWFKNATALEERLKIHDNLKGLNDILLGMQEERQTLLNAMKIQLERGLSGFLFIVIFKQVLSFKKEFPVHRTRSCDGVFLHQQVDPSGRSRSWKRI